MAKLSAEKRARIARLIVDHHLAFAVEVLGPNAIKPVDLNRLVSIGVLKHTDVEHAQVAMQAAHTIGKLGAEVSDTKLSRMSAEQFWMFVATAPPQYKDHELDAINAARFHVGRAISNLGAGLVNEFEIASEEDHVKARHAELAVVQHEIGLGIARGSSPTQILRRLRRKVSEAARDWALVVITELHNAQDHGKALSIARTDPDHLVYKRPRPDACRFCKMLYLTSAGVPRVFRLSVLVNNGTNVGRKAGRPTKGGSEWKPVVGCAHPACQCELHALPDGFKFDANGKLVASLRKAVADYLPPEIEALIGHNCEA